MPALRPHPAETETVAWLVRYHLLMSATAFKRDLSDFKTILDFCEVVQSPERLRLLLLLTVVDIRAVGPGVWNSWKRQLLSDLYDASEEVLRLGHKQRGRTERIVTKQADLGAALAWEPARFEALRRRLPDSYWIAEPVDVLLGNARTVDQAGDQQLSITARADAERGGNAGDGLCRRSSPACSTASQAPSTWRAGNIIDARIHTTKDGMALDNLLVQDPLGRPFDDASQLGRIESAITESLAGRARLVERLSAKPAPRRRAEAFDISPNVLIDNRASNRFTVVEVNARDRPALLNSLAYALFDERVTIHSAHVADLWRARGGHILHH